MDWIERCQAGDDEAFEGLFEQYKNLVFRTAYLLLDNAADAEDVLQEVFVQVHRSLHTYQRSKGAFTTWLHRITVNRCLTHRRKRRPLVVASEQVSSLTLGGQSPWHDQRAEEEALRQALRRLSPRLRAVVILRYYLEYSYAEIAQVLDVPVGTVKSRLNLALKTLRIEVGAAERDALIPGIAPRGEVAS